MTCRLVDAVANYEPGLTLTYFSASSNFATMALIKKNGTVMDSFEMIAV